MDRETKDTNQLLRVMIESTIQLLASQIASYSKLNPNVNLIDFKN